MDIRKAARNVLDSVIPGPSKWRFYLLDEDVALVVNDAVEVLEADVAVNDNQRIG